MQDRQQLSMVHSTAWISHRRELVLDDHRALLHDAQAGEWVTFAGALEEHQSGSHGLESGPVAFRPNGAQ